MENFKKVTIVLLLIVCLISTTVTAKPASVLLQEGLYAEEIDGDLDKAIKIYEQIIAEGQADEQTLAQAMYRLGMCNLKKQNEPRAKEIFERLIAGFPNQKAMIDKVKPLLEDIINHDPAALMPPETKIYIELGSPGRQIETILKMLEGTPFANPLAVIGGGRKPSNGQKSPGDIMAALLNPSMMVEFKKIRGMAVGITGLRSNNPPMVAVLYPGKSDALRGILLAVLGMVGTPGEPIEGMQTLWVGDNAGIAHDDTVIIIVHDDNGLERLTWCVRQYKGISNEPTLVSKNKTFSKLGRKRRQDSVVTIWLDGAGTFKFAAEQMARSGQQAQLALIDGIADFNSIEEVVAHLSINQSGIGVEANIGFKDGHNCLAYNLIRTPNLTRSGFEAVPADAVALASFALGEFDDSGSEAAQQALQNLTGLDIGREIFANIEQVTIFVLPPAPSAEESVLVKEFSPVLLRVGVVVTSHNPQKTHQFFNQLFTVTNLMAAAQGGGNTPQISTDGKYALGVFNDQPVYCYMQQQDKSTVITLSVDVLQDCLSALEDRRSVLNAGPLQEPLSELLPETSKLVLVNVGGAIRNADAHISSAFENPYNPIHQQLGQLAQACDSTSIRLNTDESFNSLSLSATVNDLPAMNAVFGLLMQLSQADIEARYSAADPKPANEKTVSAEVELELNWTSGRNAAKHKVYFGTNSDKLSLLGEVTEVVYAELPKLKMNTVYYWRVEEVQQDGSVIPGDIWSFNTGALLGWWKMDEKKGDIARDSSGNKNHGKLSGGPVWQPKDGVTKGALLFDGSDDKVELPSSVGVDVAGTVAVWINCTPTGEDYIWYDAQDGPKEGRLYIENNRLIAQLCRSNDYVVDLGVDFTPYAGDWHHIAFTWENAGEAELYIDGTEAASDNTVSLSAIKHNYTVLGEHGVAPRFKYYNGLMDDVRIYNYALSQLEIARICSVTPKAIGPGPAKGAKINPSDQLELSWVPGVEVVKHKVYFGTDSDKLSLLAEVTEPIYSEMPALERNTVYYWRVDEVQAGGKVTTGDIWNFNTGKLLGWWKFDETDGGIAHDSSGSNNDGMLTGGPVWQPSSGKIGGALQFDGNDDYVTISNESNFDLTDQITVAAWIKVNNFNRMWQSVVTKGDNAWRLHRYVETNNLKFNYDRGARGPVGSINVNDGKWHHVSGVYDGSKLYLYVDGSLDASVDAPDGIKTNDFNVCIGECLEIRGRYWNGMIDDVRIYNYALSQQDIAGLYKK